MADFGIALAVSNADGGREPAWSRKGDELFFRSDRFLAAAPLSFRRGFAVASVKRLFDTNRDFSLGHGQYDVMPDGKEFLFVRDGQSLRRHARAEHCNGKNDRLSRITTDSNGNNTDTAEPKNVVRRIRVVSLYDPFLSVIVSCCCCSLLLPLPFAGPAISRRPTSPHRFADRSAHLRARHAYSCRLRRVTCLPS